MAPIRTERGLDRLVNFSDATVAIAITLLILPLVDAASQIGRQSFGDFVAENFWEILAFCANVWLSLLVGLQLSSEILLREAWPIALAVIALHLGRAVAIYGCLGLLRFFGVKGLVTAQALLAGPKKE